MESSLGANFENFRKIEIFKKITKKWSIKPDFRALKGAKISRDIGQRTRPQEHLEESVGKG